MSLRSTNSNSSPPVSIEKANCSTWSIVLHFGSTRYLSRSTVSYFSSSSCHSGLLIQPQVNQSSCQKSSCFTGTTVLQFRSTRCLSRSTVTSLGPLDKIMSNKSTSGQPISFEKSNCSMWSTVLYPGSFRCLF